MLARRLSISGRVQGVGYRESLIHHATSAGLVGWVRNRRDGTVEAWLQGDDSAVQRAIEWCRRGPPVAGVTHVAAEPVECDGALRDFRRRGTE